MAVASIEGNVTSVGWVAPTVDPTTWRLSVHFGQGGDDAPLGPAALGVQLELPAVPGWVSMGMWFDTTFGGDGGDGATTPRKTTAHALSSRPWM
jgi:hypothetical protein